MAEAYGVRANVGVSSIAQRILVPHNLAASLSVVTVPREDLGVPSIEEPFELNQLVPQLFGIPASEALTSDAYAQAVQMMQGFEFWEALLGDYCTLYSESSNQSFQDIYSHFRGQFDEGFGTFQQLLGLEQDLDADSLRTSLAEQGVIGQLENWPNYDVAQTTLFPSLPPIPYVLQNVGAERTAAVLDENGVSPESLLLTLRVRTLGVRPSPKVRDALENLYDYEIPVGSSPETESPSLRDVLNTARKVAVAPLLVGALSSAAFIQTGEYALAIEAATTSAKAYIAIAGPLEVTHLVSNLLTKNRTERSDE